jgi:SAM-dependent methyltransferase
MKASSYNIHLSDFTPKRRTLVSQGNERTFDPKRWERLEAPERQLIVPYNSIQAALEPYGDRIVADIGSGTGYFSFALLNTPTPPQHIHAIDLSDQMNQRFSQRLAERQLLDKVTFHEGSGEKIPLSDGLMDIVMMGHVFHEFSDPLKAAQEAFRILRDSGRLLVVDWEIPTQKDTPPEAGPPYEHRCSEEEVRQYLLEAGFGKIKSHIGFKGVYALTAVRA